MNPSNLDFDSLLKDWSYAHGEVSARRAHGADGRPVLQLRIDLGVLQIEVAGRPDGTRPGGQDSYLEALRVEEATAGDDFELDDEHCSEIDREFVQYYHRRVAWLALREFDKVVADADHTLALMDFSSAYAPSDEWVEEHEQYRPFVLFHRTQAAALAELQRTDPEAAVLVIDDGVRTLREALADFSAIIGDDLGDDESLDFVDRLEELRRSILVEYDLKAPLSELLADAIAREQYELAAELRDRIARRSRLDSSRQA
ncbi:UvrB/uvrC motif protein [Botrimarina colliarenosi]|uniref:UvrB/uvrC motif protein n=1 Tax=Botrimarina colliarenosi TaxID=2528001 RepID=A0A5C6A442_9BACT|nr:UvrB/UvrC motif-containing protein [Botrimarina colliarenosi]TWT94038.1 UvrB/uvrC motif protein [Botrimarina colliarenosi]